MCLTAGLGGGLASPLLGSLFAGLVPTTSSGVTVSSPATVTQSSPASSPTSHADRCDPAASQYASPSTPLSTARRSKTSTPVQKPRLNRDGVESSPRRSTTGRHDSLSSTSSVEHPSTVAVKSQSDCAGPSLESSLLSAEAAMYASSSLFFPFALPHLSGALPFPGLLPPVSSASSSSLDDAYLPPSLLPPPPSSDASSKAPGSSAARARPGRTSRDGDRAESRVGRSVIVSPTSSVTSDPDTQPPSTRASADRKSRDLASTWCPTQLSSSLHQSPPHKV